MMQQYDVNHNRNNQSATSAPHHAPESSEGMGNHDGAEGNGDLDQTGLITINQTVNNDAANDDEDREDKAGHVDEHIEENEFELEKDDGER